jgi:hypothetical protein
MLTVYVDGEDDMQVIDLDTKDTGQVFGIKGIRPGAVMPSFLLVINMCSLPMTRRFQKWEVASGRLLYTFFPIDSAAYLTRIPSGYYSCSPEAAKVLHYVKGLRVINFQQADTRYNRPDKVLEYIGYPDTALINAYRNAYYKRIRKLGIDTTEFRDEFYRSGSDDREPGRDQ